MSKQYFCPDCKIKFTVEPNEPVRCPACLGKTNLIPVDEEKKHNYRVVIIILLLLIISGVTYWLIADKADNLMPNNNNKIAKIMKATFKLDTAPVNDFYINYQGKAGMKKLVKTIKSNCLFKKNARFIPAEQFKQLVNNKNNKQQTCSEYSAAYLVLLCAEAQKYDINFIIFLDKVNGKTQPEGVHFGVKFNDMSLMFDKGADIKKAKPIAIQKVMALVYNKQARDLIKEKKWKQASSLIERGLELYPDSAYLLFTRCVHSWKQGMFDFAVPDCKHALEKSGDAAGYLLSAKMNMKNFSLAPALFMLKKALKLAPDFYDALYTLTELRIMQYPVTEASKRDTIVSDIEKNIKTLTNKKAAGVYLLKAKYYFAIGKISEAEDELKKSINNEPQLKESYYLLANYYLKSKTWDLMNQTVDKLLKIAPNDMNGLELKLAAAHGAGNKEQIEETAAKILKIKPDKTGIYFVLAENSFKVGNFQQALLRIEKEIKLSGSNPDLLFFKARVFLALKKTDECEKTLKTINEKWSNYFNAYALRYILLINKKDEAGKKALLDKLTKSIRKGDFVLGKQLVQNGYEDEGIKLIEAYYKAHNNDEDAVVILALIYKQTNKTKELKKLMKQALKRSPNKDTLKQRMKEAFESIKSEPK